MIRVKIHGGKGYTLSEPAPEEAIQKMPLPSEVQIPISFGASEEHQPLVLAVGDQVKTGSILYHHKEELCAPVLSSVTGEITRIEDFRYPEYGRMLSLTISRAGEEEYDERLSSLSDYKNAEPEKIVRHMMDMGIELGACMDRAPSSVVRPEEEAEKGADALDVPSLTSLIVNGCDLQANRNIRKRLLLERKDLSEGIEVLKRIFGSEDVILTLPAGANDVKEAVRTNGLPDEVKIIEIKNVYPYAHPKLLIKAALGKEADDYGLSVGAGVIDVETALATLEAVRDGKPAVEQYITVSGDGVGKPANLAVRRGTRLKEILEFCEYADGRKSKIVFGGPMKGVSQYNIETPVTEGTQAIWIQDEKKVFHSSYEPCFSCGECVYVCPMRLMPNMLGRFCEFDQFEWAESAYDLTACIECGCCAHVCPARRPMVHFFKLGKRELARLAEKSMSL